MRWFTPSKFCVQQSRDSKWQRELLFHARSSTSLPASAVKTFSWSKLNAFILLCLFEILQHPSFLPFHFPFHWGRIFSSGVPRGALPAPPCPSRRPERQGAISIPSRSAPLRSRFPSHYIVVPHNSANQTQFAILAFRPFDFGGKAIGSI